MENTIQIPCFECEKEIHLHETDYGLEADGGCISITIPGVICSQCIPGIYDKIPNPPGITFVRALTEKIADAALQSGTFLRPADEAALFFTKLYPFSGRVVSAAGNHIHRSGIKDTAYDFFEYLLERTDDPGLVKLNFAAICQMDGDPERGLELMERVPTNTPYYTVIMGNLLKDIGEWDLAADNWQFAIEKHPGHAVAYQNLGYYLLHIKKDFIEAETHHRLCCALFPDSRRFGAYLGDSLFFQGKKAEALMEYQRALAIADDGPDADRSDLSLKNMIEECQKTKNTKEFKSELKLLENRNRVNRLLDTADGFLYRKTL
jgi:tetratricopeptide (TPR) repeat protein